MHHPGIFPLATLGLDLCPRAQVTACSAARTHVRGPRKVSAIPATPLSQDSGFTRGTRPLGVTLALDARWAGSSRNTHSNGCSEAGPRRPPAGHGALHP